MSRIKGLRCRECGNELPLQPAYVCDLCFGPLDVVYDYEYIRSYISRERIEAGPKSIWRYLDLLPVSGDRLVDLQPGFTPLVKADNLAKAIGLRNLFIKNDSVNPTFSFKDRVVAVASTKALELGFDTIACASTGNLAGAVAAHGAKAGLRTFIFIPADLEQGKVIGTAVYGPTVVAIKGNYDQVNRLCTEVSEKYNWAFVNINLRPYYSEGSKTLAFEVVEQLGWQAPDHVVVPIASGSLLTKIKKGLDEMARVGLISTAHTRISGAQAQGCSPVATAFKEGANDIAPVIPNTIAKSLSIGNPADGYYALQVVRGTGGVIEAVSDDEIVEGIRLLARTEGIFTETAGGVTIAVLKRLAEAGVIHPEELTVAYVTGNGLKTQEAVAGHLESPITIAPSLADFEAAMQEKDPHALSVTA